jgi:hypothetical protein
MNIWLAKLLTAAAFLMVALVISGKARSQEQVDVALVLAVDHSSSIEPHEWSTQLRGYADAFRSDAVKASIESGAYQRIAVMMFRWSELMIQHPMIEWRIIASRGDADRLADDIMRFSAVPALAGTCIAGALTYAGEALARMPFKADRMVIDVSGDEPESCGPTGPFARGVRDILVQGGIQINGLPILSSPTTGYVYGVPYQGSSNRDVESFYKENVIGGPGAFLVAANGWADFAQAVQRKLMLEIASLY